MGLRHNFLFIYMYLLHHQLCTNKSMERYDIDRFINRLYHGCTLKNRSYMLHEVQTIFEENSRTTLMLTYML